MRKLITAIAIIMILTACSKQELNIINTKTINEMGKTITTPPDYDITKNQCGTLTLVSGNTYDGHDIGMLQVKTALNETSFSLSALCSSPKINKWAAFKPGKWETPAFMNGVFNWLPPPDNFKLGDFIGYNPDAKPPLYYFNTIPTTLVCEKGVGASVVVSLARGEANPVVDRGTKDAIDMQSQIGTGVVTHNRQAIASVGNHTDFTVVVPPDANSGTLFIKPQYYEQVQTDVYNYWSIEDGYRQIALTMENILFSATVAPISDTDGGTMRTVVSNYSITRTSKVGRDLYFRLHLYGTVLPGYGNSLVDKTYSLGFLSFSGNQVISGSNSVVFTLATTSFTTTPIYISLEASTSTSFATYDTLATQSFTWTNPGMN